MSASHAKMKIAVGQMCSTDDIEYNFSVVADLVAQASDAGAKFISLPECFEWIGTGPAASVAQAAPLDGELFVRYRKLAAEYSMWCAYGGFHEKIVEGGGGGGKEKIGNSHILVSPAGEVTATYRKTHLFDVDIADGRFLESSFTEAGDKVVLVKGVEGFNVGLTTCYDMRFPLLYAGLQEAGADLLLAPSAFMVSTGEAHWETLIRARAIETQCYFAASAQAGTHNAKRTSYGHSIIVDPWGKVLARMDGETTGIAVAELDMEVANAIRSKMPILRHRRPDVYDSPVSIVQATAAATATSAAAEK